MLKKIKKTITNLVSVSKSRVGDPRALKRTISCLLPVAENRKGNCKGCGECCKLPTQCPYLQYTKSGTAHCKIYKFRPLNCRKYPRTSKESLTKHVCGYDFSSEEKKLGKTKISDKIKKLKEKFNKIIQRD